MNVCVQHTYGSLKPGNVYKVLAEGRDCVCISYRGTAMWVFNWVFELGEESEAAPRKKRRK